MDVAAAFEFGQQLGNKRGLDQAAFVVAFFVPGVGEEDVDAVEAAVGEHVFDDFDGVVAHDADVADSLLFDEFQQVANTRSVHVDGEEVFFGQAAGDFGSGGAHAEADFEDFRRGAAEGLV